MKVIVTVAIILGIAIFGISQQQAATMQIQTALANAKKAEQDAITAQKQGEADAAKAKWVLNSITGLTFSVFISTFGFHTPNIKILKIFE